MSPAVSFLHIEWVWVCMCVCVDIWRVSTGPEKPWPTTELESQLALPKSDSRMSQEAPTGPVFLMADNAARSRTMGSGDAMGSWLREGSAFQRNAEPTSPFPARAAPGIHPLDLGLAAPRHTGWARLCFPSPSSTHSRLQDGPLPRLMDRTPAWSPEYGHSHPHHLRGSLAMWCGENENKIVQDRIVCFPQSGLLNLIHGHCFIDFTKVSLEFHILRQCFHHCLNQVSFKTCSHIFL